MQVNYNIKSVNYNIKSVYYNIKSLNSKISETLGLDHFPGLSLDLGLEYS